jgi:hypothetical protein
VNGALKATLGLAVFVVVLGAVLWATTGRVYFAVFVVLGLLTGAGAWFTGRPDPAPDRPTPPSTEEPS